MKKIILILSVFVLAITLVGCSSSSKNYDNEINKILEKEKLERKDVNIKVYDKVKIDELKLKGEFIVYRIDHFHTKYNDNVTYKDLFIFNGDNELKELPHNLSEQIINSNKPNYEEKNNDKLKY